MTRAIALLVLVVAPFVACRGESSEAQRSAEHAATGEPAATAQATSEEEPIRALRAALRLTATAQEEYWREHRRYAPNIETLKEAAGLTLPEGVTVRLAEAAENGWAAEATHPDFPDRSCVMWYGKPGAVGPIATRLEGKRGDESVGRVVCDAPPDA